VQNFWNDPRISLLSWSLFTWLTAYLLLLTTSLTLLTEFTSLLYGIQCPKGNHCLIQCKYFIMPWSCIITGTIFESANLNVVVRLVMVLSMSNWASRRVKDYPTNNKNKEGWVNWSHLAWELPSTRYWRKNMRKDRSDGKMGKKTSATTGWS
jgi:hypothetical protein